MKTEQELIKEITDLTFKIEKNYPEINPTVLQDYLNTLKEHIEHHKSK